MKQEFKLVHNLEQKFWLGEDPMQFVVPFPSLGNGWLQIM
jgi:hypothetical protein